MQDLKSRLLSALGPELGAILLSVPTIERHLTDQAAADVEARKERLATIRRLDDEFVANRAAKDAEIADAQAQVKAAEEKLQKAQTRWARLMSERRGIAFEHSRAVSVLEAEQRRGAHPAIAAFHDELSAKERELRRAPAVVREGAMEFRRNGATVRERGEYVATGAAQMLQAVREARAQVGALELIPDQSEVPARIAEMRAGIERRAQALCEDARKARN